ncbi:MAG: hypothetical protein ABIY70_19745 [Capsulimonas sp.]|uniref:hypothetical protein n=1 Tax=Capsulimonas sp. TaxID=2494211 RepID=UPI0032631F2E
MAKRTIDPHLIPHPILPGRAVSGRMLPTMAPPPTAGHVGPGVGSMMSRLLPTLSPMMIAAVKPRAAKVATKVSAKAKAGAAKPKAACSCGRRTHPGAARHSSG